MDTKAFETTLRSDGYRDIETKGLAAGSSTQEHSHPFNVRALVIDGEISLTVAGATTAYAKGQVFEMAAGCPHAENIGPDGVRYIVGKRPD